MYRQPRKNGVPDPDVIIEFVKRSQPSFGAINLEDISQPTCYRVLDVLREECQIPVWHDDAQGTACVILAGLINALKLAGKKISEVRIVFYGAGAANTAVARIAISAGADPQRIIMFDLNGALHTVARIFRPIHAGIAPGIYVNALIRTG
jgi:malate dehydrogenase (oxaloacetate-decarboxylating)